MNVVEDDNLGISSIIHLFPHYPHRNMIKTWNEYKIECLPIPTMYPMCHYTHYARCRSIWKDWTEVDGGLNGCDWRSRATPPPVVSNNVNMELGGNSNDPHHIPSSKSERKLNILGSEFIQLDKYNSGSNVVLLKLWKYIIVKQHEYT